MNGTKSRQIKMGICALAAAGLFAASQGCSSSSNAGGSGGSNGGTTGGTGGKSTGGTTGGGVGGSTVDAGPPLCTGVAWAGAPLITDFSDVAAPEGGTGLRVAMHGGVYTYPVPGGPTAEVMNGKLHVSGPVGAGVYAGAGIYFDDCINATSSTGFSFVLTGSFGTCDSLKLAALFPQIQAPPMTGQTGHGVCTAGSTCYAPGSAYTVATTAVTFASMMGGGAVATVTPEAQSRITGIDFGFHGPAGGDGGADASAGGCTVDFTIDDVKFTP
jgi:hypothetical protein